MSLFSELQSLMVQYRFRPEKKFGQNFIIDEKVIDKMIEAAQLSKDDTVLEIGAGTGFLTAKLLEKCKVVAVEMDENLATILKEKFGANKNFTLIGGDFLSVKLPKFNKVVSLPPYHISTDIMLRLFEEKFELAVLVFQKEFAEKLTAEPGFPDYNYLSVLTTLRFEPEFALQTISPVTFFPKPESFSAAIVLKGRKKRIKIARMRNFIFFLKQLFRYKNKNLENALFQCIKENGEKIEVSEKKAQKVAESSGLADEKVTLIEPEIFAELFIRLSQ